MSEAPGKVIRSPSYPSLPLGDAVAAIGKIEAKYRSAPVDRSDAARLIGYSSLSGPANQSLAALAAYGLVERAGKGEMRVTQRAKAILHPDTPTERNDNLRAAAVEPQLYRELQERFAGVSSPPEEGVVSYLNRQGFNQNVIRQASRAFLATVSYLQEMGAHDSHGASVEMDRQSTSEGGARDAVRRYYDGAAQAPVLYEPAPQRSGVQLMAGERIVFVDESSPEQYLKLVVSGELNLDMLEALEDYVKRQKKRLSRLQIAIPGDGSA